MMPTIITKEESLGLDDAERMKILRNRFFWFNPDPSLEIIEAMVGTVMAHLHTHEGKLTAVTLGFLDDGDATLFRLATSCVRPDKLSPERLLDEYDWGLLWDHAPDQAREMFKHAIDLPIRPLADAYDIDLEEEDQPPMDNDEHLNMQFEFFAESQSCVAGFVYFDEDNDQLLFQSEADKQKALEMLYESFGVELTL